VVTSFDWPVVPGVWEERVTLPTFRLCDGNHRREALRRHAV
jgi:hypothetical protein